MPFKTVRDILDQARAFHRELAEHYRRLGAGADREKLKVLLDFMGRHEQHMAEHLEGYEAEKAGRILGCWFKYSPAVPELGAIEGVELKPDMTVEQVVDASLKFDGALVAFYRQAAETARSQDVKDFFAKVVDMEQREGIRRLRHALIFDQET